MKLANRIHRIQPSATLEMTAKASELRAKGVEVFNMSVGEPDMPTPSHIQEAGIYAIKNGYTRYTPGGGTHELKESIQNKFQRDNNLNYSLDEIVVSCGGKHSLYNACQVLFQKGDEIIIFSPYWVSFPDFVSVTGAKPVFVDILKSNYTIDPSDLKKKITRRTKAIIPVHLYGHMAYMDEILEIAKKKHIKIIEDASQSLGSKLRGKHSGTFSHLGCFSMYAGKVITSGEGGAVITNDKKLFEKLKQIRNHGLSKNNLTTRFGLNLRISEISAAIGKIQMRKLPHLLNQRRKNAKALTEILEHSDIILPEPRKNEIVNWYLYTIAMKSRDKAMKKLNASGIGARVYYSPPVHKTPYYKTRLRLANTEWAASHVMSLPVHPNVRNQDLVRMKNILLGRN